MPLGGISPARSLSRIVSHPSRYVAIDSGAIISLTLRPPDDSLSLWHRAQVFDSTGLTAESKSAGGVSAAHKEPAIDIAITIVRRLRRTTSGSVGLLFYNTSKNEAGIPIPGFPAAFPGRRGRRAGVAADFCPARSGVSRPHGVTRRRRNGAHSSGRVSNGIGRWRSR